MTVVGIDFGTTNSVMSKFDAGTVETLDIDSPPAEWAELGFARVMPTVIALDGKRTLFGWDAKIREGEHLEAVKRLLKEEEVVTLGGQSFVVEEIATMLFAHMKKQAAEQGVDTGQAVVTVPANSRGLARHRTKLAAGLAGFEVLALINEPTAAAMAYSTQMKVDQRILVIDWGGGTLDVTLLQSQDGIFVEHASKGIGQLGGIDFDARLRAWVYSVANNAVDWTADEKAMVKLATERAKIKLSEQQFTNLVLPRGQVLRVERDRFEHECRSLVERVKDPIKQVLRDVDITPWKIDQILLVGGTCKIPMVQNFIAEILERRPVSGIDPMTAVADGAAIAAAILTDQEHDSDFFVSTEHALGVYTASSRNASAQRVFSTIIPRNHKLPAEKTENFIPVSDQAQVVKVDIVEGLENSIEGDPDNVVLNTWEIPLDTKRTTAEDKAVDITYSYDINGILHVTVNDIKTGTNLLTSEVSYGVADDKKGMVQMSKRVRDTMTTGTIGDSSVAVPRQFDPDIMDALQKAKTRVLPFLDDAEAKELRVLIGNVEDAQDVSRREQFDKLQSFLYSYSFLL